MSSNQPGGPDVNREASPSAGRAEEDGAKHRSSLVDSVVGIAATGLDVVFLAISGIFVARALGPVGKGAVTLVAIVCQRAWQLASVGVESSLLHFGGRSRWPLRSLSKTSVWLGLVLGAFAGAGAAAVLWTVFRDDIGNEILTWAIPMVVVLPLITAAFLMKSLIQVQGRLVEINVVTLLGGFLGALAGLLVWTGGWSGGSYLGLLTISLVIEAGAIFYVARKVGVLPAGRGTRPVPVRDLIIFGIRGHFGTLLKGINDRLDVFVLALFAPIGQLGLYSISVATAEALWIFPAALGVFSMQRAATREQRESTNLVSAAARLTSATLIAGSIVLWIFGERVIVLAFGESFVASAAPLRLLLPGMWALGLWRVITEALVGYGYPGARSISAAVGAVLTISLDILLIPNYGISGAAVASSIAYGAAFLTSLWIARQRLGLHIRNLLLPTRQDLTYVLHLGSLARARREPRDGTSA
jgi:O-antigen/teichoic acid export membrane protein